MPIVRTDEVDLANYSHRNHLYLTETELVPDFDDTLNHLKWIVFVNGLTCKFHLLAMDFPECSTQMPHSLCSVKYFYRTDMDVD